MPRRYLTNEPLCIPHYCPDRGTCHFQERRRAAGAVPSTVGIEPTPSGTKPPCTSIKLCYRCGLKTHKQNQGKSYPWSILQHKGAKQTKHARRTTHAAHFCFTCTPTLCDFKLYPFSLVKTGSRGRLEAEALGHAQAGGQERNFQLKVRPDTTSVKRVPSTSTPRTTPAPSPPRFVAARDDGAHCGAGPPCTFRYACVAI